MRREVRPALRTAEVFERLHGGDFGGSIVEFLAEFSEEIRITGA